MSEYLQVRNWKQFQHYKDRDPKWFKVYTRLLSDADFMELKDWQQGQLLKLWLLAAASDNKLPSSNSVLSRYVGSSSSGSTRFRVQTFLELGYLEEWRACEPKPLAQKAISASLEVETEVENYGVRSTNGSSNVVALPLKQTSPPKDSSAAQCREIFDYWVEARGKSSRFTLTTDRRQKIQARLREGRTVADLKRAIDGVANDAWEERSRQDDLTIIFGTGSKLEKFLDLADNPPEGVATSADLWQRDKARLIAEGVISE